MLIREFVNLVVDFDNTLYNITTIMLLEKVDNFLKKWYNRLEFTMALNLYLDYSDFCDIYI